MKALDILVVEDDSLIAMLLGETLAEMGHGVCGVEATETGAVTAALRYRPDLIIVDAQLREGNGVSAVDEILRSDSSRTCSSAVTLKKVLALGPGAVVIEKPFRELDLIQAIHLALYQILEAVTPVRGYPNQHLFDSTW